MNMNATHSKLFAVTILAGTMAICGYGVAPTKAQSRTGSYSWPVKPFHEAHPVRGNFGDPRTSFDAPPTVRGLMSGSGAFSFHFGVDVAVPDGTLVYPVASGVARLCGARNVHVDHGGRFATEYWHIVPMISNGQHVTALVTPLGRVLKGYEHVHFTEFRNGVSVNPLMPGHLTPYSDQTQPEVSDISFRTSAGEELLPEYLHGTVDLLVHASDRPSLPVPGRWSDLPVAPAYVDWHVERVDGTRVASEQTAFDVRSTIPANRLFWHVYARGSRQNMSTFDGQRAWRLPGVYIYRLASGGFDTRRLQNGIYRLVVTAGDTGGNSASASQTLIVRNADL
jgi:hypothetical protein